MQPGCQLILQHSVLPGNTADCDGHIRFSLSFRKFKPESDCSNEDPCSTAVLANSSSVVSNTPTPKPNPATLMLGDSFLARLNATKLGKSKKVVLNMAKGGNKISDVVTIAITASI